MRLVIPLMPVLSRNITTVEREISQLNLGGNVINRENSVLIGCSHTLVPITE